MCGAGWSCGTNVWDPTAQEKRREEGERWKGGEVSSDRHGTESDESFFVTLFSLQCNKRFTLQFILI